MEQTIWDKKTGRMYCRKCNHSGFKRSMGFLNKKSREIPEGKSVSFDRKTYMTCLSCGYRHLEGIQHYGF